MRQDASVLVLDDDRDFATTLKSILEAKGYPAVVAHDGAAALRIVRGESIAVAVIDFKLDDMPGIEVLRKVKQRAPSTECLLLTGHASQELAIEAINLGGFGFLQKPCNLDQLLVMVRRAVEKRDALEALRESERHTRAILHSSLDAVVTVDEMGFVVDWNPKAERLLGWHRREALGREFFDLIFDSEDEALRRAWGEPAEISLLGRPVEATLRHKDGHEIEVEWAVTSVEVADRHTMTFFIEDVTRRKGLEEQFLQAQRMEAVNLLAGGVLHDFGNLLTAIMGQSALLRQDVGLGPDQQQSAQEILQAAQRASGLARQLRAYSRPHVREPEMLDLNSIINDMSRMLKRVLGEHVDLRLRLAGELKPVEVDRSEIEQVIVNLVTNARHAMPEGGVLLIETADVAPGEHGERGEAVQLVVRDYGTGMESTTLIRAFEPFFTTRTGRGAGLGLSTVKNIVEASGGDVALESTPGKGTSCRILLPVREQPDDFEIHPADDEALSGSETVLVVEDEDIVRATVTRMLTGYGYDVLQATGGRHALKVAQEHSQPIHLLLTDVVMPHMSGKELAADFARLFPEARVLFISGYSGDVTIRRALGEGADLLPKPFTPVSLLKAVRKALDA